MLDFIEWLTQQDFGRRCILSVRDILSWVNFVNAVCERDEDSFMTIRAPEEEEEAERDLRLDAVTACVHAACLVYIDGLGSGTTVSCADSTLFARQMCLGFLQQRLSRMTKLDHEMLAALRLNLASQSVLEGLNACFDHRAEIYIPELGMSFQIQHEKTKIFGCQNPFTQGGGRKGLPKSFLNRFTQLVQEVCMEKLWGHKGSPWEFNLRDIFRWCQLMQTDQSPGFFNPGQHVALVYADRMRTEADKAKDTEFLLQTWGVFCQWLKENRLQRPGGTVNSEALNKLEVIILLLQKLNTKLKVFTGND
ncbi:hypothetical protein XENOCAPTIV_007947 [Xenoophorus captivus]|uniref:Midasin AAA lid domain-containing protein n=1 Tax=Xenoophorus captivus TaxID=1517983 RepID=A0ABV0S239_9TELE